MSDLSTFIAYKLTFIAHCILFCTVHVYRPLQYVLNETGERDLLMNTVSQRVGEMDTARLDDTAHLDFNSHQPCLAAITISKNDKIIVISSDFNMVYC